MRRAYRASIFHCLGDPGEAGDAGKTEYFDDGLLIVADGVVEAVGPAAELSGSAESVPVTDLSGKLIAPGFIDCHVHFPQVDVIASYGEQLLDWLHRYAYPAEMRYADAGYAAAAAEFFLDELLRNGTTSAAIFATVHPASAEALFAAAEARNMRVIAGKVLMDRDCPEALADDPESAYEDSRRLIERWHNKGRLGYAITPRFAITSSDAQLAAAGRLAAEFTDVWVHTHLAENHDEVEAVARRFPEDPSYLDVYDRFGLVRRRSIFAHCLHMSDGNRDRLAECESCAAFCPTSNLFLGSGLFDLRAMRDAGVEVGLATDVGGGTSLSMFATMNEAYKVLALQGQTLPASRAFYLATLGAAKALDIDRYVGNLAAGKEADFVVLDSKAPPMLARRIAQTSTIDDELFALMMLADDRSVHATAVSGELRVND